ncbi:hypothetical protein [Chitiniphilus eburneus]|uniref:hypothetical protein n=1 Tax=Chitiniphilus eburneus TaxID=2571148 RepID=UPI0035D00D45
MTGLAEYIPSGQLLELSSMSTQQLRTELAKILQVSAKQLIYMAAVWAELERRGEDLTDLRRGLGQYLPMIAAGALDAEAVVRHAGNTTLLKALATLPVPEQRRLLADGHLRVLELDESGQPVERLRPLPELPATEIRRLIHGGRVIPIEEQHVTATTTATASNQPWRVEGSFLVVGRTRIPIADIRQAIKHHRGAPIKLQDWTDAEVDILRQYGPEESPHALQQRLPKRTISAIRTKAIALKIPLGTTRPVWSDEEDELIRTHYPELGAKGVQALLPHRTVRAISLRGAQLGVKRRFGTNPPAEKRTMSAWSKTEDAVMRAHYAKGMKAIQPKLPGRTPKAIRSRAVTLGLTRRQDEAMARARKLKSPTS